MTSRKSVMNHRFSEVPKVEIPRSSFDRSHGYKTTFDAGYLIPIFVDEALPGATFNVSMTAFARLATPIKPIMDNLYMDTFFFAVPNRLLWENWEKFNGSQEDPGDSIDFTIPQFTAGSHLAESIHDYMGVPPSIDPSNTPFSALPARAYNLIWNEWFRDQNLQDSAFIDVDDNGGNPNVTNYPLRRRGKRHDYFTSCLPWPQKGDAVNLPLGTEAPVRGIATQNTNAFSTAGASNFRETGGVDATYAGASAVDGAAQLWAVEEDPSNPDYPYIRADLSGATAATINSLRQAFQIQRMLERDARGGTRYVEVIKNHFGVTSPDFRLQRPEYLGGGSSPINFNPVTQTEATNATTPQANLSAYATATLNNHGFVKSFTEHCTLIGLVNVRADLTYQQGLNRMFSRETRYDFFWPTLQHIGEQEVLNKEIFIANTANDNNVFGYQERYAEYRYKPSLITGKFRSDNAASLDIWHLSQDFAGTPLLSDAFIQDDPPIDRIIAVNTEPHFLFDAYFSMRCARPMSLYGVPGLIDHF